MLCNKMFLKISPNSQKNTCAGVSFLIKLQASIFLKNFFVEHLLLLRARSSVVNDLHLKPKNPGSIPAASYVQRWTPSSNCPANF